MINLKRKQRIILMHLDDTSNREIASVMHMSKDTINKYVKDYDFKKRELLKDNPTQDEDEIIQTMIEKPKYDASNRKPSKVSNDILNLVYECLKLNEEKRRTDRCKQIMLKKIFMSIFWTRGIPLVILL